MKVTRSVITSLAGDTRFTARTLDARSIRCDAVLFRATFPAPDAIAVAAMAMTR
jgi:hypothetical protein